MITARGAADDKSDRVEPKASFQLEKGADGIREKKNTRPQRRGVGMIEWQRLLFLDEVVFSGKSNWRRKVD